MNAQPVLPACMSIKTAARYLDMSVSAFKRLKFPGFKAGGLTRYETERLNRWIREKAEESATERELTRK
jgi:hypothetical protein